MPCVKLATAARGEAPRIGWRFGWVQSEGHTTHNDPVETRNLHCCGSHLINQCTSLKSQCLTHNVADAQSHTKENTEKWNRRDGRRVGNSCSVRLEQLSCGFFSLIGDLLAPSRFVSTSPLHGCLPNALAAWLCLTTLADQFRSVTSRATLPASTDSNTQRSGSHWCVSVHSRAQPATTARRPTPSLPSPTAARLAASVPSPRSLTLDELFATARLATSRQAIRSSGV